MLRKVIRYVKNKHRDRSPYAGLCSVAEINLSAKMLTGTVTSGLNAKAFINWTLLRAY